jgi:hypothetical protein
MFIVDNFLLNCNEWSSVGAGYVMSRILRAQILQLSAILYIYGRLLFFLSRSLASSRVLYWNQVSRHTTPHRSSDRHILHTIHTTIYIYCDVLRHWRHTVRIITSFIYNLTSQSVSTLYYIYTAHSLTHQYSTVHYLCRPTTAKLSLQTLITNSWQLITN